MTVTVFEIPGTSSLFDIGGQCLLSYAGSLSLISGAQGPHDTWFKSQLDPTKFTWRGIAYPAAAFPMDQSVAQGKTATIDAINTYTSPGDGVVLIGTSQGAIVASDVYDEFRTGSLSSRNADLLGAVTFGNPRRQNGHTFPNCPDPGGNGIDYNNLLTNTETRWWDFANPGDIATVNNNTTLVGQLATAIYNLANLGWDGTEQVLVDLLTHPISTIVDTLNTIYYCFWDVTSGPHTQYNVTTPLSGSGDTRTCIQIALDYINTLG